MSKQARRAGAVVATALAAVALAASPAMAVDEPLEYVALGDSAAAGPLIVPIDPYLPCARSDANYPTVAADILGAELNDVTCSGAVMPNFAGRQFGFVAPQYDALTESTDLVSVTIGGNDVGLVQAALSCVNLLPEPAGASCADRFTAGGKDELADKVNGIAGEFAAVLDEIERRSPDAQIAVAGYGTYIQDGGCYPAQPIWARDADYIQDSIDKLSGMMREQTEAHGGTFVDIAQVSEGHDVCKPPAERHLEGLIPGSPAAPLHPNKAGMAAFGAALADAVQG